MHKLTLTLSCILLITQITAMEVPKESNDIAITQFPLLDCKEESAAIMTAIIAYSESKDALRKTCRRVCDIMQNKEAILKHPLLRINETALSKFFPYYGILNNTKIIHNLITKGVNNEMCYDLMHYAAQYGYSDIATTLVEQSNLSAKDLIYHPRPLKCTTLFRALNNKQSTTFFTAIDFDQSEIIKKFLSLCALEQKEQADAFCYAAEKGAYNVIQILLNNKFDIHTPGGKAKIEPFWYATSFGHIDIMRLLIDNGATLDCSRPEYFDFFNPSSPVKHFLHTLGFAIDTDSTPETLALYHCAMGDCIIVQKLLSESVSPNTHDENGKSLMHYAAEYGYLDIVNVLLEHPDFVPTDITNRQLSPLCLAMNRGNHAIIKRIHKIYTLSHTEKHMSLSAANTLLECYSDNSLNNENASTLFGILRSNRPNA